MRRTAALVAATALTLVAPAARTAAASPDATAQIRALLARRAAAVTSGDMRAFDATMALAPAAFRAREDTWFLRMRALPIASYSLAPSARSWSDLAPALRARPRADEVHVVDAEQRIAFTGFDPCPSDDDVFLTIVRSGSRWSIVSDTDLDDLGLLSERNVWDLGAVRVVRTSADVTVITRGPASVARRVGSATSDGIAYVRQHWPLSWPGRALVVIPASSAELSRVLRATFDLGPFVAFTVSTVERETDGSFSLVGSRVYVQPSTFFATGGAYEADTLSHELTHLATRGVTGIWVPAWLDEGVAQSYGQRTKGSLTLLASAVRAHRTALPEDWQFTIGSHDEIHLAYEESLSFVEYLRARFGSAAGARFYRAAGAQSPVSFGTRRYHLDLAARATFGRTFASLQDGWIARLEREY